MTVSKTERKTGSKTELRKMGRIAGAIAFAAATAGCQLAASDTANQASQRIAATAPQAQGDKPNFIFVLADDIGITDLNAYAARYTGQSVQEMYYRTPHLDRLANEGVAFSQAYAAQLCSPTRAALLTGKFAPRLGFMTATPVTQTYYSAGIDTPAGYHPLDATDHKDQIEIEQPFLNAKSLTGLPAGSAIDNGRDETTIAEALAGYRSGYLGKWHVGGHGAAGHQPADQGFEPLAYFDAGGSGYFNWTRAWDRTRPHFESSPQAQLQIGQSGGPKQADYLTDDLTNRAVAFIDENARSEQPFLLYFAQFSVHTPIQAKDEDIALFEGAQTAGWNGHRHVTYAAMVKSLDDSIGRLMQAVQDAGISDNTYIVFMSDNGGVDWQLGRDVRAIRVPPGEAYQGEAPPTSNTPFRGGKATLYEGGVRVPLIVWGPDLPMAGQWIDRSVDMTDIFPTLLDLSGADLAPYYQGGSNAIDGQSLVGLLNGDASSYDKDAVYWHYPYNVIVPDPQDGLPAAPSSAIRQGDYKLIVDWHGSLHLFNVEQDPFEQNDLATIEPQRTKAMLASLSDWLKSNVESHYFPPSNPSYQAERDPRGPSRPIPGLTE